MPDQARVTWSVRTRGSTIRSGREGRNTARAARKGFNIRRIRPPRVGGRGGGWGRGCHCGGGYGGGGPCCQGGGPPYPYWGGRP
nr:hypothetical protein GCM10010200_054260 [Actinomadura rugatobispora]